VALAASPSWEEVARDRGPPPEVWRDGRQVVVSLRGEHDLSTAPSVAEALARASALGDGGVVVDLSGVLFMDAAVIRELVDRREALRLQSRALTVRAPSTIARRVLDLCELTALVEPVEPVPERSVHVFPRVVSAVVRSVQWRRAPQIA
jgi:anti-anti-sigma factor